MTALHTVLPIDAGVLMLASITFAVAAVTFQNKGWQADAFKCVMCALGCAVVAVMIW